MNDCLFKLEASQDFDLLSDRFQTFRYSEVQTAESTNPTEKLISITIAEEEAMGVMRRGVMDEQKTKCENEVGGSSRTEYQAGSDHSDGRPPNKARAFQQGTPTKARSSKCR
jgi:hypothetical protein